MITDHYLSNSTRLSELDHAGGEESYIMVDSELKKFMISFLRWLRVGMAVMNEAMEGNYRWFLYDFVCNEERLDSIIGYELINHN